MSRLKRTAGEQIVIDDKWALDVDKLRREVTDWLEELEFDGYQDLDHVVKELRIVGADVSIFDGVDWVCKVTNDDEFDHAINYYGIEAHDLIRLVKLDKVNVDLDYTKPWLMFGNDHEIWSLGSELDKALAAAAETTVNTIVDAARKDHEEFDRIYNELYVVPVDAALVKRGE